MIPNNTSGQETLEAARAEDAARSRALERFVEEIQLVLLAQ